VVLIIKVKVFKADLDNFVSIRFLILLRSSFFLVGKVLIIDCTSSKFLCSFSGACLLEENKSRVRVVPLTEGVIKVGSGI
jgi:hypothetical protein